MARAEDDDLLIEFSVRLTEINDDKPAETLVHEIHAATIAPDAPGHERAVGYLTAFMFNINGLMEENVLLFVPYAMREQHLAEAANEIFDFEEYKFLPNILEKADFADTASVHWHLHAFRLYLQPAFRGRKRGIRALRLLRRYVERPGLLVTARAFPTEPGPSQDRKSVV